MPKYLVQGCYTESGAKGLLREGGTVRRESVRKMIEAMGGKLEAFYYAFGDSDVYVMVDAPDNVTTAAISMAVNASGAVSLKTIVLLTPEEMDGAANKMVDYQPPGA